MRSRPLLPLAITLALLAGCGGDDATDEGSGAGGSAAAAGGSGGAAGQAGSSGKGGAAGQGGGGSSGQAGSGGVLAGGSSGQAGSGQAAGSAGSAGPAAGASGGGGAAAGAAGQGGSSGQQAGQGGASGQQGGAAGGGGSAGQQGGGAGGQAGGEPTAEQLLAATASCDAVSNGNYKTDDEAALPADIAICGLTGAVFWTADMDVDCDGQPTDVCNSKTDPAFQDQTSATDASGKPLIASELPYVVVPLPSSRFDYGKAGLELGSVIAVVYKGQVAYGVFGDEGPDNIIGEASYAMAKSLGVDPDPATGGTDGPVTYIAFTGKGAVVADITDHAAAVTLGQQLAKKLLGM